MLKFDTKTFHTTPDATHKNIRDFTVRLIKALYEEVEGIVYSEVFSYYEDDAEVSYDTEFDIYNCFICVRGMKREDYGIITRHGIVNSIHPYNDHARDCLKKKPILPNVPLYPDGRGGKFKNDYFFEIEIVDEDGDRIGGHVFVLNSKRLTKELELLEKMKDTSNPIPKQFTI